MNKFCSSTSRFISLTALLLFATTGYSRKMVDYIGPLFPADHALNMPIDNLPVHANSANLINTIGANTALHPDFGTEWEKSPIGIPYNLVGASQPKVPISYNLYGDESDPGPWPIPTEPFVEGVYDWRTKTNGDRHLLVIDTSTHLLYETGNVTGNATGTSWVGGCGAIFDLNGYALRKDGWTSADAAGLPIFPLLIRYDEVEKALAVNGEFHHAIRFTVDLSKREYIWPARHYASSSTDNNRAPMGLRFRLKADFDISGFTPRMQVILRTMKKYGMIVADNGSNWNFQGSNDERWSDGELNSLKTLKGKNFEAVDISSWMKRPGFDKNSAKVPASGSDVKRLIKSNDLQQKSYAISAQYSEVENKIKLKVQAPDRTKITISTFDFAGRMTGEIFKGSVNAGQNDIECVSKGLHQDRISIIQLRTEPGERACYILQR